jgi:hypothetical protein
MLSFRIILPFILFLLYLSSPQLNGQTQDTLAGDEPEITLRAHSAHRASVYSALLPGLGQIYNKKYWKLPVIYGGFGTLAYFGVMNTREYRKFREAYNYVNSGDTSFTDNDYAIKYGLNSLRQGRDYYRRNVELTYILGVALYILNIVDAAVDAHLMDFDVSDDLSMQLQPMLLPPGPGAPVNGAISLTLRFK